MTSERGLGAIVLAAGMGTRMKSDLPKVLHAVAGKSMILHVLDTVADLAPERAAVVIAPGMDAVAAAVAPVPTAVQDRPLGTAHAVLAADALFRGFDGDVLILFGDCPLITADTLRRMVEARRGADAPALVLLAMRPAAPNEYGRIVVGADGAVERIVEWRDASEPERALPLCNSGVLAADGRVLFDLLDAVGNANAKGEYYLTEIVAIARARGLATAVVEGDEAELLGVNSRVELAAAEAAVQERLREAAMLGGAGMIAPETVFLAHDTKLGRDVRIGPHVVFGPGVEVGDRVEIKGFCHIEGARIAAGAVVGPYARLRPGADIGPEAHIGNFVEVKNATIEAGAKANHLAYLGDARVGAGANVGAGTITCNYDGFFKHRTDIGAGAFIGSNTALVAPVSIGDGAVVAAGSTVTRDAAADALAIERAEQVEKRGWAKWFRERKAADKAGGRGRKTA
jgi:bifunctional UDP-N-acetylglucosamine pyrophosphorylase / glucosamine-1-phosphate N-acetyltransferase